MLKINSRFSFEGIVPGSSVMFESINDAVLLLDGPGKTSSDIRDLFNRLKRGGDFAVAFEESMGIPL